MTSTRDDARSRLEQSSSLLHNVTDRTIEKISITGERPNDSTEFKTGSWLEGRLLILDLAYFKFRHFARIDENGAGTYLADRNATIRTGPMGTNVNDIIVAVVPERPR